MVEVKHCRQGTNIVTLTHTHTHTHTHTQDNMLSKSSADMRVESRGYEREKDTTDSWAMSSENCYVTNTVAVCMCRCVLACKGVCVCVCVCVYLLLKSHCRVRLCFYIALQDFSTHALNSQHWAYPHCFKWMLEQLIKAGNYAFFQSQLLNLN